MVSMLKAACVLVATCLVAAPVHAQSADDLFDPAELHDVWVHINSLDWAQLRATFMDNTFYPCDFEWRGLKVRNAGCRSRGTGSRSGTKPALEVDFNYYVRGQTLLGLEGIVLDNQWQDASMIKERLSMRLFERLGLPAPRETYARLHVGGARDYIGVYAMVEKIDEAFLQRLDDRDGHLYEFRWIDEYGFEDLGAELEPYAARFEARTHTRDSMFDLYAPVRNLVYAINEASDTDLEPVLARSFDIRALLLHLAAENYLGEWDGFVGYAGMSNFYLHGVTVTGLYELLAWDKDSTFAWLHMPPSHNFDRNVLTRKIWANRRLRTAYLQALLAAAGAAGELEADAVAAYEQIRAAALEDPLKPYSNEQFKEAAEDVMAFTRARADIVRAFVRQASSMADIRPEVARAGHRQEFPVVPVRP